MLVEKIDRNNVGSQGYPFMSEADYVSIAFNYLKVFVPYYLNIHLYMSGGIEYILSLTVKRDAQFAVLNTYTAEYKAGGALRVVATWNSATNAWSFTSNDSITNITQFTSNYFPKLRISSFQKISYSNNGYRIRFDRVGTAGFTKIRFSFGEDSSLLPVEAPNAEARTAFGRALGKAVKGNADASVSASEMSPVLRDVRITAPPMNLQQGEIFNEMKGTVQNAISRVTPKAVPEASKAQGATMSLAAASMSQTAEATASTTENASASAAPVDGDANRYPASEKPREKPRPSWFR